MVRACVADIQLSTVFVGGTRTFKPTKLCSLALLLQLLAMGLGGSLCTAEELLPPPIPGWIMVDLPARLPKTCLRLGAHPPSLDLSQGGRFAEGSGGLVVKSGHVVGMGSSLVPHPSRESELIGYVDNSGLAPRAVSLSAGRSKACAVLLTARGV